MLASEKKMRSDTVQWQNPLYQQQFIFIRKWIGKSNAKTEQLILIMYRYEETKLTFIGGEDYEFMAFG